jgi:hypothetical protein
MAHRKTGVSTGTIQLSPARARRRAQARVREERAWRDRSGPVTIRRVDPEQLRRDQPDRPT